MTRRWLIVSSVGLVLPSLAAAKKGRPRRWQEGHVVDAFSRTQSSGAYAGPLAGGVISIPLRSTWQYYIIRSKTTEYIVGENSRVSANVLINGYLDFAIERGVFYFVDMGNYEHVAVILRQTLLPAITKA